MVARNALDMGTQQQQIALLQQLVDQLEQGNQMLQKERDQELQHAREVPCAASSARAKAECCATEKTLIEHWCVLGGPLDDRAEWETA